MRVMRVDAEYPLKTMRAAQVAPHGMLRDTTCYSQIQL